MKLGTQLGLGHGHIVLDGDPAPPLQKGGRASKFSTHLYFGQTAGWIKMALGMEVGLGQGHIVLHGDTAPPPQNGGGAPSPIVGPFLLWSNGWMHQDATWYGGRPRARDFVLHGDPAPSPKMGGAPKFSARVYCGQMAGWIKMALGTEVGISPARVES